MNMHETAQNPVQSTVGLWVVGANCSGLFPQTLDKDETFNCYQDKTVSPLKKPPTPSCLAPSIGFVTTPVTP